MPLTIDKDFQQWLIEIRRELHAHPETAFNEFQTTKMILDTLSQLGIETHPLPESTGAVGLISGKGGEGPVIALRADIDALPMDQQNNVAYRSKNPGCMHACGHDANTAIVLGVAKKIVESGFSETLKGKIKLLFQPAEEYISGARTMIDMGVLDNPKVDCVIAGHMTPDLPIGDVGLFKQIGYASSDTFHLKIEGKGGHGGRPEQCHDPIVAGAFFITQLQSIISRNVPPGEGAVLTVGQFLGGSAENIIPAVAELKGTLRAWSPKIREMVLGRMNDLISGLELSFSMKCSLTISDAVPVLINNDAVTRLLQQAACNTLGNPHVNALDPIMGSEDFAFFTEVCPAAIIRLGCANQEKGIVHPLHSPFFDIDESVLGIGVEIFFKAISDFFDSDDGAAILSEKLI